MTFQRFLFVAIVHDSFTSGCVSLPVRTNIGVESNLVKLSFTRTFKRTLCREVEP